jgi:hypothetical protein
MIFNVDDKQYTNILHLQFMRAVSENQVFSSNFP